jgi:hypothetical protein
MCSVVPWSLPGRPGVTEGKRLILAKVSRELGQRSCACGAA